MILNISYIKSWVRDHPNPRISNLFLWAKSIRSFELPASKTLNSLLFTLYTLLRTFLSEIARVMVNTPIFKGRLDRCGKNLYLYCGVPYVSGPLKIEVGNHCRVSGQTTFSGRTSSREPTLIIGDNVGIGWQTTIAVGSKVIIKDNVRIAGRSGFYGYPGHPLNKENRAKGLADTDDQIGDICLEKDVWLANNVSVMAGVTIGEGTIVAAGSIVTKDLPANVLAAGNPAKVIKTLDSHNRGQL